MKKKGFTLIELLAVIVVLAVISMIGTPIILGIIEDTKENAFKDSAYGISGAAKNKFIEMMYAGVSPQTITFTYTDGTETSNPGGYTLNYTGGVPKNGRIILNTEGKVFLILHDGKYCATKGYDDAEVTVEAKALDDCMPLADPSRANAPVLTAGMTAVIWDGGAWVPASNIDNPYEQNWYNYNEKEWANARTSDGSLWVWIPRYAYQIATNYHTNTTGTINVKFLQGVANTTKDGTPIATTPTYSDSDTQSNFIKHPAFTFGTTELTGIWVSKFEMSGTSTTLASKPSIASYRNLTIAEAFTYTRNMETLGIYGWATASGLNADGTFATNTNNVDTHMMKNMEWGAVAYLTQSSYGKNAEVWVNPSTSCITGCAGTGATVSYSSGCSYYYDSANGQQASTTGNIYGVYDMAGGAWEYIMANYNNVAGSSGLTPASINDKYIDRYTGYDNTKFGDAVWETSSIGVSAAWYGGFSNKVSTSYPWFGRGMNCYFPDNADVFTYFNGDITGTGSTNHSWRVVILAGSGL